MHNRLMKTNTSVCFMCKIILKCSGTYFKEFMSTPFFFYTEFNFAFRLVMPAACSKIFESGDYFFGAGNSEERGEICDICCCDNNQAKEPSVCM